MAITELTSMARQWNSKGPLPLYCGPMASSEVDRKFLGHFAKATINEHGYLSSFLFRILGLSVVLSEDLLQARRAKRLDPIRDPQHRRLVHHILWLAREGLVMIEQYVLPMVGKRLPPELQVLVLKLKASLYHIFVLFHNDPPVNDRMTSHPSQSSLFPLPLSPKSRSSASPTSPPTTTRQRSPAISLGKSPPGLTYPGVASSSSNGPYTFTYANLPSTVSATYLLPLTDYRPAATTAFKEADLVAERLLPGSHPVRLSVKVEYVAYLYDCVKDREGSRRLARRAVREVYEETAGMDDESFEDAAELVGILGRMMKRGLSTSAGSGGGGGGGGGGSGGSTTSQGQTQSGGVVKQQQQQSQPASKMSAAVANVAPSGPTSRQGGNGSGHGTKGRTGETRSGGGSGGGGRSNGRGNGSSSIQSSERQRQGHRRAQSSQSQSQSQGGQVASNGSGSGSGRGRGGRGGGTSQPTTWV